ncbi:hypothetical protein [Hydrogenispora ethanolica]|uniref:hypothetical protein n=1 Tax=Hydrogenispora ethanolica TaxID=1082276 RepID=UPI00104A0212|nr:hypothetical protein [Hydrogenispora ethanolica]
MANTFALGELLPLSGVAFGLWDQDHGGASRNPAQTPVTAGITPEKMAPAAALAAFVEGSVAGVARIIAGPAAILAMAAIVAAGTAGTAGKGAAVAAVSRTIRESVAGAAAVAAAIAATAFIDALV